MYGVFPRIRTTCHRTLPTMRTLEERPHASSHGGPGVPGRPGRRKPGRPKKDNMVKTSIYLKEEYWQKLKEVERSVEGASMASLINSYVAQGLRGKQFAEGEQDLLGALAPRVREALERVRAEYGIDEVAALNLILAEHLEAFERSLAEKFSGLGGGSEE